jgi:hypothetical protein
MHRIIIELQTVDQWYSVIREANTWFGPKNWRGQNHVRKKLERNAVWWGNSNYAAIKSVPVWFDVPDPQFATWVKLKYALPGDVKTAK